MVLDKAGISLLYGFDLIDVPVGVWVPYKAGILKYWSYKDQACFFSLSCIELIL